MAGKPLKVAIVHDWLYGGGAERVVYELHKMFPDAPIYTSYCTNEWQERLDHKVITGFLQYWPFNRLRKFLPVLRIWWFTHLDFSGYDLVISSSGNGEAKGVKVPAGTTHICYSHAPTHFYWRHYQQYLKSPGFGAFNPLVRVALRLLVSPLRKWDLRAAQRPDFMIANSTHTRDEIKTFYGRDAEVIQPPIDIARFAGAKAASSGYFMTAGRQTPYKHNDIIIEACNRLQLPLVVIGRGPEHDNLRRLAGPTVIFPENVSDQQMATYMAGAKAFIFAAFEDFGITPVEALAAGTPLVAYKAGGALDYVEEGRTGAFFTEQTAESLTEALKTFDPAAYQEAVLRAKAASFSPEVFCQKMNTFIQKAVEQ